MMNHALSDHMPQFFKIWTLYSRFLKRANVEHDEKLLLLISITLLATVWLEMRQFLRCKNCKLYI